MGEPGCPPEPLLRGTNDGPSSSLCAAFRDCVVSASASVDTEALSLDRIWKELVERRAVVVDRFARLGTRYLVFRPVRPDPDLGRASLTPREREAVEAVVQGMTCSEIAQRLGVSLSTAATHRARALAKLGLGPHELPARPLWRAYPLDVASWRWFVAVQDPLAERLPVSLTPSEREVASLVAHGYSNAEIAARRGRSVRTVANQVAALLRKLDVSSRWQLVQKLSADAGATPGLDLQG